jgi:hypothetical protein
MKKILLLATTLALACGLVVGGAGSALAVEDGQNQGVSDNQSQNEYHRGLFGTVDNITIAEDGTGTISLINVKPVSNSEDGAAEIAVTENTTYHIPTVTTYLTGGAWQTWDELTDNSTELVLDANRVAILLTEPATDQIAQKVMIVPEKNLYRYRYQHRVGVVVEVDGNTATVAQKNGEQFTVQLGEGVEVEAGQFVIMVTERASGETQLKAVHCYRLQNMVERLKGHIEGSLNQQDYNRAKERLQASYERHIAVMEQIQTKLQDQNRTQAAEAVGEAIQRCEARYDEALQFMENLRERVRDAGGWEEWASQWSTISGTITSVDPNPDHRTVVIDTGEETVTLQVPFRAGIVEDGKLFALSSLEVGDEVATAVYHVGSGGINIAIYIELA